MSTDKLGRRSCDGCSRHITKAQRIHEGKEYCGTCYKREFKRAQCPYCEGTVVHHRSELEVPQCPRCDRSERRCNRCNRLAPEARHVTLVVPAPDGGSITECVVACLSCYPYFTEAIPCDICKEPSQRLSGASHLEPGQKACPRCINKATHTTCSRCRRYRKLVQTTDDGRKLCGRCSTEQPATHNCPECGTTVNGAGSARCDGCSIKSRLRREVEQQLPIFQRSWVADLYRQYGEWLLIKNVPTGALPKKAGKAAGFFLAIDGDAQVRQPLIAADLLRIFDTKALRANLNATDFVCEHYGLSIDKDARNEARDLALIEARLSAADSKPWGPLLREYRVWLTGKQTRTVSQYLGVAEAFCESAQLEGPFSQEQLLAYLAKVPGARATISVWVTFVQKCYGWQVTMPPRTPKAPNLKRGAVKLLDLLARAGSPPESTDQDLADILCLVYQFEPAELRRTAIAVTPEGDILTKDGLVQVQAEMRDIVLEWSKRQTW